MSATRHAVPERCSACGADQFESTPLVGRDWMLGKPGEFEIFVCAGCGSGTTSPFVSNDDLAALYEGAYAPFSEYSAPRGLGWLLSLIRSALDVYFRRSPVVRQLPETPGRLLEVGCGMGRLGETLAGLGWNVTGIEPSPMAAEHARARGLEVHVGTLSSFPRRRAPFDAVLFRHSLEHVVFPREEIAAVAQMLKPGGTLIVEVPNFGCWQVQKYGGQWFHLSLPMHRTHFTAAGLRSTLDHGGFESAEIWLTTGAAALPGTLEHRIFGRWLHHSQLSMLAFAAVSALTFPVAALLNRLRGGGDILMCVAQTPSDGASSGSGGGTAADRLEPADPREIVADSAARQ